MCASVTENCTTRHQRPWELLVRGVNLKCQLCKCPGFSFCTSANHTHAWEEPNISPQLAWLCMTLLPLLPPQSHTPSFTAVLPLFPFHPLRRSMFIKPQVLCIWQFLCFRYSSTDLLCDWILSFWGHSNASSSSRTFLTSPTPWSSVTSRAVVVFYSRCLSLWDFRQFIFLLAYCHFIRI